MVRFYIEADGESYQIRPHLRYLVYFKGGFCPPHRGHFNQIRPFLGYDNVTIFIHQIGSERRHGVPETQSRQMWQTYLEELVSNPWHLVPFRDHDDVNPYLNDIDRVVYIRGDDGDEHRRYLNSGHFHALEARFPLRVDVVVTQREPVPKLSATNFVQQLIRAREKHYSSEKLWYRLRYFLPRDLDEAQGRRILRALVRLPNLRVGPKPRP